MNIVELSRDELSFYDNSYWADVRFLGDSVDLGEVFDKVNRIYKEALGYPERSVLEMVENWLDKEEQEELLKDLQEYVDLEDWIDEDTGELTHFETLEDFLEVDDTWYWLEIIISDTDDLKNMLEANDIKFGTVGYSPWSYYLAYKDVDDEYIQDLYEGWNFYIMSLMDKDGIAMESIGFMYIKNTDDLVQAVKDHFGIDYFFLVDNEDTKYFKGIKRVKRVPSYHYKIVE